MVVIDKFPQVDGRTWVTEGHVLPDGSEVNLIYLCNKETDPQKLFDQRDAGLQQAFIYAKKAETDPVVLTKQVQDLHATAIDILAQADAIQAKIDALPKDNPQPGDVAAGAVVEDTK